MAKLFVAAHFQYKGRIYRSGELLEDSVLTVPDQELLQEKAKGKHPKTKKWLSPLLNHCEAADNAAAEILGSKAPNVKEPGPADEEAVESLRAEFDQIGKSYDRRWGADRLETELAKAKKEVGA